MNSRAFTTHTMTTAARRDRRFVFPAALAALACSSLWGTSYYVSPDGNDRSSGTSSSRAWRTIAQVNTHNYQPGDQILFLGGFNFPGSLNFTSASQGTAANPIVISSYGGGAATILAGTGAGLFAYNTGGFSISAINFTGSGASTNANSGISFYADLSGGVKLDTIRVNEATVSGFGQAGVMIGSWNGQTGFTNVRLTYVVAHDNGDAGIQMYGQTSPTGAWYAHQNVYVGHCQTYNNQGRAGVGHASGSGITISAASGVTIERSLAYGNGTRNTFNGGPSGIWTYDSTNVIVQYNESHHNHTGSQSDGDGFDFDGGVTNSVLQYNYSHDNDGAGFLAAEYSGAAPNRNNVMRDNISQNDARKNAYAAVMVWNGGGVLSGLEIYNNTVYLSGAPVNPTSVMVLNATTNVHFRNNIFGVNGPVPFTYVSAGQAGLLFQGNDYFTYGAAAMFLWGNGSYNSLSGWRSATGQEVLNGQPVGYAVDPMLNTPGAGNSIDNPDRLNTLAAYRLLPGSPMIDHGLNLFADFQMNPGPLDFWGDAIVGGSALDVGANKFEQ